MNNELIIEKEILSLNMEIPTTEGELAIVKMEERFALLDQFQELIDKIAEKEVQVIYYFHKLPPFYFSKLMTAEALIKMALLYHIVILYKTNLHGLGYGNNVVSFDNNIAH